MLVDKNYTKLMVIDDHPGYRKGIISIIKGSFKNFDFVPNVEHDVNGSNAMNLIKNGLKPHIVILDIQMKENDGFEIASFILTNYPKMKIVFLTMFEEEAIVLRAMKYSPVGFLLKDMPADEMVKALKDILNNHFYFDKRVLPHISQFHSSKDKTQKTLGLDEEELQIIQLITEGKTNKEIGGTLAISPRTIEKKRVKILEKTKQKNTSELIVFALEMKLAFKLRRT